MADKTTVHSFNQSYPDFADSLSFSSTVRVSLSVIAALITVFIAVANGIIIVALVTSIRRDHGRGRNIITKILMTSMAFTDASLALTILPVAVYKIIRQCSFFWGTSWCLAELILDYFLCTGSICHVIGMALDRYLAVCRPLMYRKMTNKSGYLMITLAWILPFVLACCHTAKPYIHIRTEIINGLTETKTCVFDTNIKIYYVIIIVSLYLPFLFIFLLYFLILREVGRFHRRRPRLQAQSTPQQVKAAHEPSSANIISEISVSEKVQHGETNNRQTPSIVSHPPDTSTKDSNALTISQNNTSKGTILGVTKTQSDDIQSNRSIHSRDYTHLHSESSSLNDAAVVEGQGHSCELSRVADTKQTNTTGNLTQPIPQNKVASLKAVRTVGSIVICFTLCWLPFAIFALIRIHGAISASDTVDMTLSWLAYINSALNPLVYCSHKSIRSAVKHIIRC